MLEKDIEALWDKSISLVLFICKADYGCVKYQNKQCVRG